MLRQTHGGRQTAAGAAHSARQLDSFADAGGAYRLRLDTGGRNVEWTEEDENGKQTACDVPP